MHSDTVFALGGSCTLLRVPLTPRMCLDAMIPNCVTVAAPLLLRNGVLVGTVSGDVTYISRATGGVVWTQRTGGTIRHHLSCSIVRSYSQRSAENLRLPMIRVRALSLLALVAVALPLGAQESHEEGDWRGLAALPSGC